jgi:predicted ArsR family transcriptional regulator
MRKSIYRIVGKLRREKTDNETLKAIKSLSLPTTATKVAKRLGINRKSTMNRIRRLETQGKAYRKSKNGNGRCFFIYVGKKKK